MEPSVTHLLPTMADVLAFPSQIPDNSTVTEEFPGSESPEFLEVVYNPNQKFALTCNYRDTEDMGSNMTRISTCGYKSDCHWDISLHKKQFHNEPKREADNNQFMKQRLTDILSILEVNQQSAPAIKIKVYKDSQLSDYVKQPHPMSQKKRDLKNLRNVIKNPTMSTIITNDFAVPRPKKLKKYNNRTQVIVKNEGPFQITKEPYQYREVSKQRVKKVSAQEMENVDLQKFTISKRSHFSMDMENEIQSELIVSKSDDLDELEEMIKNNKSKIKKCPFESCDKEYRHQSSLLQHVRTHTQKKNYKCSFCGKRFVTNGNLKDHERRHLNMKLFKCEKCNMKFYRSNQLKTHQKQESCFQETDKDQKKIEFKLSDGRSPDSKPSSPQ